MFDINWGLGGIWPENTPLKYSERLGQRAAGLGPFTHYALRPGGRPIGRATRISAPVVASGVCARALVGGHLFYLGSGVSSQSFRIDAFEMLAFEGPV